MSKIKKVKLSVLNIGLGGTGFDGIMKLKSEFHKRFEADDMLYCVMDTDECTLGVSRHGVKLEEHEMIRLFPVGASFTDLKNQLQGLPFIREWFDETINPGMIGNGIGAGCYRQVGRLMFFRQFGVIKNVLRAKLTQLATVKPGEYAMVPKVVQVNLIAGISGGTGGGVLLDTAYLIRQIAEEVGCRICFKVYLIMPDVSIDRFAGMGDPMRAVLACNGYAVLKELDYWMEAPRNGAQMVQQYTTSEHDVIKWEGQPFDFVFKMGKFNAVGAPIHEPYDHALSAVSDYLVSCYSSTDGAGDEMAEAIDSGMAVTMSASAEGAYGFQVNDSNKYAMVGIHPDPKPVFYLNESLGSYNNESQERIELVQQRSLIYNAAVERMDTNVDPLTSGLFVSPADLREFNDYLLTVERAAAQGGGTVRQGYDQRNPFHGTGDSRIFDGVSEPVYSKTTLREAYPREAVHGGNYYRFEQIIGEKEVLEKNKLLDTLWTLFVNKADEIGRDLEKGPEYLYLMLNVGEECFLNRLTEKIADVRNRCMHMQNTVQMLKNDADALFKKFKDVSTLKRAVGLDETPFRNYLNACRELYNATRAYYYLRALRPAMSAFREKVTSYTYILERLVREIRRQQRSYAEELSTTHVDSPLFNIDNMRQSMAALCADERSKANFTSGIFNKTMDYCEQWTGQNVDMATLPDELDKALESLRETTFAPLLNLGLEEKIKLYENLQTTNELVAYVKNIMAPNLRGGASPMFAYEGGLNAKDAMPGSMSIVSIPQGAANIRQGIEEYSMTNNVSVTIKEVPGLDRIFWVTNQYMMPMYRYKHLKHLRDAYNSIAHTYKGYHLYMKDVYGDELVVGLTDVFKRESWRKLIPDLFVERYAKAEIPPVLQKAKADGLLEYNYTWPDFVYKPGVTMPELEVRYCKLYPGAGIRVEPVYYTECIQKSKAYQAGAQGWDAFVSGLKALDPSEDNRQAILDGLNKLKQHRAYIEELRAARENRWLDLDHLDEKMMDWGEALKKSDLLIPFNPGETPIITEAKKAAFTECYERAISEYIMRNKILLDEFEKQGKCIRLMDEALERVDEEIRAVEEVLGSLDRPDRDAIKERAAKLADLMIYDETAELQTASFNVSGEAVFNVMKVFSAAVKDEFANCDALPFVLRLALWFGVEGIDEVMVRLALNRTEAVKDGIFADDSAAKLRVATENAQRYKEVFESAEAELMNLLKSHTIGLDDEVYYEQLVQKMVDAFDSFVRIVKKNIIRGIDD